MNYPIPDSKPASTLMDLPRDTRGHMNYLILDPKPTSTSITQDTRGHMNFIVNRRGQTNPKPTSTLRSTALPLTKTYLSTKGHTSKNLSVH